MEEHAFVYTKTNKGSWGDAHDEAARGKTTCTPKRKCWHSCDHIMNIVQKQCSEAGVTSPAWVHSRHRLGMLRIDLRMDPWSMAFHSSIMPSVNVCTVWGGFGRCETRRWSMSTDVLMDPNPTIELASPWHWFLPDPGTPWRLWVCVLGHYLASGWNLVPHAKGRTIGWRTYLDTSQLLESPCQGLANPYGYPWRILCFGFYFYLQFTFSVRILIRRSSAGVRIFCKSSTGSFLLTLSNTVCISIKAVCDV